MEQALCRWQRAYLGLLLLSRHCCDARQTRTRIIGGQEDTPLLMSLELHLGHESNHSLREPPEESAVFKPNAHNASGVVGVFREDEQGLHWPRKDADTAVLESRMARICRQLAIPVAFLIAGGICLCALPHLRTLAQLLLFFGAQTFMNLYMKALLSTSVVRDYPRMMGFQAPLVLTALQQVISFVLLLLALLLLKLSGSGYEPRRIQTKQEWAMILFLAVTFSANIALNNFSLSLIDISANLTIRSTSPVSALLLQVVLWKWFPNAFSEFTPSKLSCLMCGIACVVVVTVCKSHGANREVGQYYIMGLVVCICSVLSSSMELILVVVIGKTIKLNAIETILYMSLPVALLLTLPAFLVRHCVAYELHPPSTDWQVLREVWALSPATVGLVLLSGPFALMYNGLLYAVVSDLSPFYTSFAANFNKVGAIALALVFHFEALPPSTWGWIMVLAVLGNMAAFTAYSLLRLRDGGSK